jgi:hypothetical protein
MHSILADEFTRSHVYLLGYKKRHHTYLKICKAEPVYSLAALSVIIYSQTPFHNLVFSAPCGFGAVEKPSR